jgi:hypothetical protein
MRAMVLIGSVRLGLDRDVLLEASLGLQQPLSA